MGHTGPLCETRVTDKCVSSLCQNGGICQNSIDTYHCVFPWEFAEKHCEQKVKQLICDSSGRITLKFGF